MKSKKTKKDKKAYRYGSLSVGGIIALILIVGAFMYSYLFDQQTKTYTNNDLHFSLEIPENWTSVERTRADGYPKAELVSGNKQIVIDINEDQGPTQVGREKVSLPPIKLGTYTLERSTYKGDGKTQDYIDLYNVPDQYPVQMNFAIKGNFDRNNATLLKILKTFKYTEKEKPISTYFTYTLPDGWKTGIGDYMGKSFVSEDYKVSEGAGYTIAGVMILVRREHMPIGKTITDIVHEFPDKVTNDITPINIDGIEGLTKHENWESHGQVFLVQKGNYLWRILVFTKNLSDENLHRAEIDSFITSLHFK